MSRAATADNRARGTNPPRSLEACRKGRISQSSVLYFTILLRVLSTRTDAYPSTMRTGPPELSADHTRRPRRPLPSQRGCPTARGVQVAFGHRTRTSWPGGRYCRRCLRRRSRVRPATKVPRFVRRRRQGGESARRRCILSIADWRGRTERITLSVNPSELRLQSGRFTNEGVYLRLEVNYRPVHCLPRAALGLFLTLQGENQTHTRSPMTSPTRPPRFATL